MVPLVENNSARMRMPSKCGTVAFVSVRAPSVAMPGAAMLYIMLAALGSCRIAAAAVPTTTTTAATTMNDVQIDIRNHGARVRIDEVQPRTIQAAIAAAA